MGCLARIRKKQSGRSDRQIPNKTNLWRLLIKLAGDQAKITLGNKHRVAIVGPCKRWEIYTL